MTLLVETKNLKPSRRINYLKKENYDFQSNLEVLFPYRYKYIFVHLIAFLK